MKKDKIKDKRFIVTERYGGGLAAPLTQVLVDRNTGVNYIFVTSGYAGGLTPLLDREGKPIITSVAAIEE